MSGSEMTRSDPSSTTGDTTEKATIEYLRESPDVGGERYARCTGCGREVLPPEPDRLLHKPDCELREAER